MSESRTKAFSNHFGPWSCNKSTFLVVGLASLILCGEVLAQPPPTGTGRAASFLPEEPAPGAEETSGFSGLAAPPELVPPPMASGPTLPRPALPPQEPEPPSAFIPAPTATQAPITAPRLPAATSPVPPSVTEAPVMPPTQPTVASTESIGVAITDNLGVDVWKGTPRPVIERLLSMATVTTSPTLNNLMRRLLTTAATPPERNVADNSEAPQSLTSLRIEKLVGFGDADAAWSLAIHADPNLIDDVTFHYAAEAELATNVDDLCATLPPFTKMRTSVDWRKTLLLCQLRDKSGKADPKIVQDMMAALNADTNRDGMFLEIANKNILNDGKTLPHQLTPLTPTMLALLRQTSMSLPGDLYGHPDFALVPALLRAPARQDVAQLGLGERAAERGIIGGAELGAIYRSIVFIPDELATPLAATESGSRQRALYYQAALNDKRPANRILYAIKFMQTAPPAFLNGAGTIAADMLGSLKPEADTTAHAVAVAQIYMMGGRGELALEWLRAARREADATDEIWALWPQFTLAGLEGESDYAADLVQWLDATLKAADPQADNRPARDNAAATLLLLDAAGFQVPDTAWAKVLVSSHNEKRVSLSPVLLSRLQSAGAAGRRGETILLATSLASDGEISLPAAMAVVRALSSAGLKNDAGTFARQTLASMAKAN